MQPDTDRPKQRTDDRIAARGGPHRPVQRKQVAPVAVRLEKLGQRARVGVSQRSLESAQPG